MKNQKAAQIGGVRERYVRGAGATPVLRTSRVGSAALVAPAPGTTGIQHSSATDTKPIDAGYKPNRIGVDR